MIPSNESLPIIRHAKSTPFLRSIYHFAKSCWLRWILASKPRTPSQKQMLIDKVSSWRHCIDLGEGLVTPGRVPPDVEKIKLSAVPESLKNKTVLDIGASDGYHAFECEKRGARVTAIDQEIPSGFFIARELLHSDAGFRRLDLFDIPKKLKRKYDIVLFFGILYHLKYPLRGLEILRSITKELLIVESHYIKTPSDVPMMRFYPADELDNNPTNWWGPNIPCIIDMLHVAGFSKVNVHGTYQDSADQGRVIVKACP